MMGCCKLFIACRIKSLLLLKLLLHLPGHCKLRHPCHEGRRAVAHGGVGSKQGRHLKARPRRAWLATGQSAPRAFYGAQHQLLHTHTCCALSRPAWSQVLCAKAPEAALSHTPALLQPSAASAYMVATAWPGLQCTGRAP